MTDADGPSLLGLFFDEGVNKLTLQMVARDPDLRGWAERLSRFGKPTVLPLWKENGEVLWHAIARSEPELQALRESLGAYLGPTYADLAGTRLAIRTDRPVGAALQAYSGGHVLRFRADSDAIRLALRRMFAAWDLRPQRVSREGRSPGVLRREFEMALRARDAEAAREAFAALRDSGALDAANDLYLQVQYCGTFGRWQGLLALPEFRDLVALRRPAAVTDTLLQAVYHVHVAPRVRREGWGAAREAVRERVIPEYAGLLASWRGLRSLEAWTVAAAWATEQGDLVALQSASRHLQVLGGAAADAAARWLVEVESTVTPQEEVLPLDLLSAARDAMREGDLERVIAEGVRAAPSEERARLLLQAGVLLHTLDAARTALSAVDALDSGARTALLDHPLARRWYEHLRPIDVIPEGGALPPASWSEWLDRLIGEPTWPAAEVRRTAELGAQEWPLATLTEVGAVAGVVDRINRIPNERAGPFAESLPYLLESLQADGNYPDPTLESLYGALLEHLALVDVPTVSDLRVYVDLLPSVLGGRLDAASYVEVLGNAQGLIEALRASPTPTVVLDLLDALAVHPCRDVEARLRLLTLALSLEERHRERWEDEDRTFLARLAREFEAAQVADALTPPTSVEGESPPDPLTALAGQYVAIYTLTESAGQRAQVLLETVVPGVRVETSSARGGDERLKAMAAGADVFVMVTASAKHAATGYIETHRPEERPLLRPQGKGTASLLRALREYAAGHPAP